jgi:hypothetical protein
MVDADEVETKARAEVERLREASRQYLTSPLHESLKVRRNRFLAHSLEITIQEIRAQEQGRTIAPITVGNEEEILAVTLPLVVGLNGLLRDLRLEFESLGDVWSAYAEDYWLRFSGRPKRRRSLRDLPLNKGM